MNTKNRDEISARFIQLYRLLYAANLVNTKKEFCEKVGLLQQNFSLIEQGRSHATLDHIHNAANRFPISLEWLILGKGEFIKK